MRLHTDLESTTLLSRTSASHAQSPYRLLCVIVALGLVLRLGVLFMSKDTGLMIDDEQHYHTLALNLLHGHGLAWEPGALTSIRPPLYPSFLTFVWTVSGTEELWAVRIAQILLNLCKNAVEAMPQGGTLTLRGCSTEAHVTLEVGDTGIGIPEGLNIFEPFTTTKEAGTGLGLAIVQQIVAAHQGTISYTSRPNQGTTFTVTLPAVAQEP